jgi:outer membrane protein assembly factor BamB
LPPEVHETYEFPTQTDSLSRLTHELVGSAAVPDGSRQVFPEPYTTLEGVVTFRGGPRRTGGAWGTVPRNPTKLEVTWKVQTGRSREPWNGGTGWTGEPVIVRWPGVVRHSMPALKKLRQKKDFVEVIQGSLDGKVYFLDLVTGRPSRPPIDTGNPIKGSVSLDPRGYPLLFVGQGIPYKKPFGLHAYNLITQKEAFFLAGNDAAAPRHEWGAFDSSGLFNRKTDSYLVGGENGLVYLLSLHTVFDPLVPSLTIAPEVLRYRYRQEGKRDFGVENSLAVSKNLAFFGDNSGTLQALDLRTFTPLWAFAAGDDTDASLTLELEGEHPVLYTGCEVDKTGPRGDAFVRKLDGVTGKPLWQNAYACHGLVTPKKTDAGVFATNAVGTGDVADLVYFMLASCPTPEAGYLVALDKATGREAWRLTLEHYSWSSPTLVRDPDGKSYLLTGGLDGTVRLLDARSGREAAHVKLNEQIEASPAVFDDRLVLGTRSDRIYGLRIVGDPQVK